MFLPERGCHDSSVQQHWLSANTGGYFVLLCDGVSCKLLWPLAGYIVEDPELLVFSCILCWDCRCESPCPTWGLSLNKINRWHLANLKLKMVSHTLSVVWQCVVHLFLHLAGTDMDYYSFNF